MSYLSAYDLVEIVRRTPDSKLMVVASDAIIEEFSHHSGVPSHCTGTPWDMADIRVACYDIGEMVYAKFGLRGLREIYSDLRGVRGGVAARFLEYYWDGVGNGAWSG